MAAHQSKAVLLVERLVPRDHLVRHDTERVLVRRAGYRPREALLRADVCWRADDGADLCERLPSGDVVGDLGDPEVRDVRVSIGVHEDVRRFHVTVKHALFVRLSERARNLCQDTAHDRNGKGTGRLEDRLEGAPLDVVHREEMDARGLAHGEHANDARMPETGDGGGFLLEALHHALVGHQLGQDQLDGNLAPKPDVFRQVHGGHSTAAELCHEMELADGRGLHLGEYLRPLGGSDGGEARLREHRREPGLVYRGATLRAVAIASHECCATTTAVVHPCATPAAETIVGHQAIAAAATGGNRVPAGGNLAHVRGCGGSVRQHVGRRSAE